MKIIESVKEIQEYCQQLKREGKTIASVDTDGELHDGHMTLVKIAKENADVVVLDLLHTVNYFECSPEEYERLLEIYEQDFLEKDIELCKLNNVDVLFIPSMYDLFFDIPPPYNKQMTHNYDNYFQDSKFLNISIPVIDQLITARPDYPPPAYMKYVITYREMYNIILPDIAVVGQKDVYQNFAIKSLIKQLGLFIKVIIAPTIRDSNNVPFSSSNRWLSKDDYNNLSSVYETLQEISTWAAYPSIQDIKTHIKERITRNNGIINYIYICCAETLEELNSIDRNFMIIVNVRFDNMEALHHCDNIIIELK